MNRITIEPGPLPNQAREAWYTEQEKNDFSAEQKAKRDVVLTQGEISTLGTYEDKPVTLQWVRIADATEAAIKCGDVKFTLSKKDFQAVKVIFMDWFSELMQRKRENQ